MATSVSDRFGVLVEGLDHPEGVAWDTERRTIYAGGEGGQLYAVSEAGELRTVADTGGMVLGLALDADGYLYVCSGSRVVRVDPDDGSVEVYTSGTTERPMQLPNYPTFGLDGTLYVTDSGAWNGNDGAIYRVRPGGATEIWERSLTAFPNGTCLAQGGGALYVVQSQDPGIWRVPIGPDGAAGEPVPVCALPGTVPDGLGLDVDGRLYVSCYRPDEIYRVADGRPELLVGDPCGVTLAAPTNLAFVGPALDRLVSANFGRWHLTIGDAGATGHPVPRPRLAT